MAHTRFERFLPLSGVVAGVLFFAAGAATMNQPRFDKDDPQKYVDWVVAHGGALALSGLAGAYFAFFMLFFTVALRSSIRAGEAGESTYSSVAFAGGIGVSLSVAYMSMLSLALAEAPESATGTLAPLADVSCLPWAASSGVLLLGVGLGALRTLALPRWLAITSVVLGVLSVAGPAGIAVFLVSPLWMVATGFVLSRRQQASAGQRVPDPVLAH